MPDSFPSGPVPTNRTGSRFRAVKALVASSTAEGHVDLVDVAEPEPTADQALVDVAAASLNRGEVRALQSADDGWRPGWDVAGVVTRRAADGTGPAEGTRVVGLAAGGAWSERAAVPTSMLCHIPDGTSFEDAATLPVAGLTARRALELTVIEGKGVGVTGASGGVGRFAVQLAAQSGATVTAVVGTAEKGKGLEELGAAEVVVGALPPDGEPLALVLESVGGESLAAALSRVAPEGIVVTLGNSSRQPTTFDAATLISKSGARLYGFMLFPELRRSGTAVTDLGYLGNLVAMGHLDTGIDRVAAFHDLAAVRALIDDFVGRKVNGKAVLRINR
jgi:NADPH2:quinone reductase